MGACSDDAVELERQRRVRACRAGAGWHAWVFVVALLAAAGTVLAAPPRELFDRGVLFRVDAPGKPSSWVFGTLRSNDPRVVTLTPAAAAALAQARRLAPEMLLSRAELPEYFAAAQLEGAGRLADYFDAATLARIRTALGSALPPEEVFARLKPWAVLLLLAEPVGGQAGPTMDEALIARARGQRIRAFGLELPDEQVATFDTIPVASQVALVRWTLDRRELLALDRERAVEAWLDRDLARLAELTRAPDHADPAMAPHFAQLVRHLVDNRSVLMAHRLFLPLREGRVFVAVNAVHLYGSTGLLALIRAQGYRIVRVE